MKRLLLAFLIFQSITRVSIPSADFDVKVVPQPRNQPNWVAIEKNTASLFQTPSKLGRGTGLLMHNYMVGYKLYDVKVGDEVVIYYGARQVKKEVSEVLAFQAVLPDRETTDLIDLASGVRYTAEEAFYLAYRPGYLTLQTCLYRDGDLRWGRLFVLIKTMDDKQ